MVVKYGFNADTSSVSYEKILASFRASGAEYNMVMLDPSSYFLGVGDIATIRKYLTDLPNTKLIVRTFSNSQGDWQKYPSAEKYQAHWLWIRTQLGDTHTKRIVLDFPINEPNLGGSDPTLARPFVNYCISLVKAAAVAGVKIAIGAFSVGTPHETLFETEYLPLWKAIKQYGMGISLHLYGWIPFEAGELVPLNVVLNAPLARHFMLDEHWSKDYQGWYIGRAYRYIQVFERHGLGLPELFVTECLVDNIANADTSAIKEGWKAKYANNVYPDPRGVRAWEKYLKEMFPELDFQSSLKLLFRHARKNIFYSPAFKALCIFALNAQWDYPNGTNREAGSNFAVPALDVFTMKYISEINAETYEDNPPMPTKDSVPFPNAESPLWELGTLIITNESVNMRSEPYLDDKYKVADGLKKGVYIAKRHNEERPKTDNHFWHAYQFVQDSILRKVWIADSVIGTWKADEIIPPPQSEREYFIDVTGGGTTIMKESVLDALIVYKQLELEGLKIIRSAPVEAL